MDMEYWTLKMKRDTKASLLMVKNMEKGFLCFKTDTHTLGSGSKMRWMVDSQNQINKVIKKGHTSKTVKSNAHFFVASGHAEDTVIFIHEKNQIIRSKEINMIW